MVQRTLTALFSLAVLILPASHLHADADMDASVYSGLECEYQENRWKPAEDAQIPSHAGMDDVIYHSRLGIGNSRNRLDEEGTDGNHNMVVSCPLPSLEHGGTVEVAIIDATVFDYVSCQVQSCVAGIGVGTTGEGGCVDGPLGASNVFPPAQTQGNKYITQNVDWLTLTALPMIDPTLDGGARPGPYLGKGAVYTHLLCTLPERDDVSPQAPGLGSQMRAEQGISYIQSYYVDK